MKISFKHDYLNLQLLNSMWGTLMKESDEMTPLEEDEEMYTKRMQDVLRIQLCGTDL